MSLHDAIRKFRDNFNALSPTPETQHDHLWWNLSGGLADLAQGTADEVDAINARLSAIEQLLRQLTAPASRTQSDVIP